MLRLRDALPVALALALGLLVPSVLRADDSPPGAAPAADPAQAAALARADELDKQFEVLFGQRKYAEATPLVRAALAIREKALGLEHLDVSATLNNLAVLLQEQQAFAEAQPLYERALAIAEKALGPDHLDVVAAVDALAKLVSIRGDHAAARLLFERALAVRERTLGPDHPDVATSLTDLGVTLYAQGLYADAQSPYERALAIREKVYGPEHPEVASSLACLGQLLWAQGAYAEARAPLDRSLAIRERVFGPDSPKVATSLALLAELLKTQCAYAEARQLFERVLAISVKAHGADHVQVATDLGNLATILELQGAGVEARSAYERALHILERVLGPDHPQVAAGLHNLGHLLLARGAPAEARPLLQRALNVDERVFGKGHPEVASDLTSLAMALRALGDRAGARVLLERALAIREQALGRDHPSVAHALNGLAVVLDELGAPEEALPLFERALAILEKALGSDHEDVAAVQSNLAGVYFAQGAFAKAQRLNERALAAQEGVFGPAHPSLARLLNNLAAARTSQGLLSEAQPLYERTLAITGSHLRSQFSGLSAAQRLGFVRSVRPYLDNWLAFAPGVDLSGYAEVLRFRGLVARAQTAERVLARHAGPAERALLGALAASQSRAARLANQMPPASQSAQRSVWQRRNAEANAERERLTIELSTLSAPLRGALERLDLGLVDFQRQLGPEAALVDLLRVRGRYLAWIVRATGEPVRVEVGADEAVETACAAFVKALGDEAPGVSAGEARATAGATLRRLVWAPIQAQLGEGVSRVVLVPDAALAAVPFGALPGKAAGTFLLDDLKLSYVMQAQDLVPWREAAPLGSGTLMVGGVDYDQAEARPTEAVLPADLPALAVSDRAPRGGKFLPIPETLVEAEGLRTRLGAATSTLLAGAEATEGQLRAASKGKRILHIATHGFAREDLLAGLYDRKIQQAWISADTERQLAAGHDPMLLSGLALAGANPREGGGEDDGILTALEASYLDLDGVELVVLSACETAKGTAESGEGVQGLVSAFQMAGARHVLASLWKVDDEATRLLMEGFYERLLRKESPLAPADALREASLALRDRKEADGTRRFAAPRFWAAFVAYGR